MSAAVPSASQPRPTGHITDLPKYNDQESPPLSSAASSISSSSEVETSFVKSTRKTRLERPRMADRQRSSSIIIPKTLDTYQKERPNYPPDDARAMSPRRSSEDLERLELGVRKSLQEWVFWRLFSVIDTNMIPVKHTCCNLHCKHSRIVLMKFVKTMTDLKMKIDYYKSTLVAWRDPCQRTIWAGAQVYGRARNNTYSLHPWNQDSTRTNNAFLHPSLDQIEQQSPRNMVSLHSNELTIVCGQAAAIVYALLWSHTSRLYDHTLSLMRPSTMTRHSPHSAISAALGRLMYEGGSLHDLTKTSMFWIIISRTW